MWIARAASAASLGCLCIAAPAGAQTLNENAEPPTLASCASIEAAADRLACYDRAAGRVNGNAVVAPAAPAADAASAPIASAPAAPRGPVPAGNGLADGSGSLLSRFWELDEADKRGTFNFTGYRANYFLPAHLTSRINTEPSSPTRAAVSLDKYRRIETKFQLSLRTKIAQGVLLPGADLWLGYTQQSFWQLWNREDSTPFRSTDYEPELIYVVPVPQNLRNLPFGWQWRLGEFGFAHQSDGQAKPLSRSWNRVYFGAGIEHDGLSILARVNRRLAESDDDNPDLLYYRGRADITAAWTQGLSTVALNVRSNFKSLHRGSLQVDWSYPVKRDKPNGLRWYVQLFSGYAETLLDYNFRQTSGGIGLSLLDF